jgi:hypothetical protein
MCYTENGGSAFWFMTASEAAPDVSAYFRAMDQELDWETHVTTVEQFASAPFDVYIASVTHKVPATTQSTQNSQ